MLAREMTAMMLVALTAGAMLTKPALAEYPEKEVTIISPSGPGPRDTALRFIAACLGQQFGKPVVVLNKPGANSQLGANIVKAAAPDGYTLLFGPSSQVADYVTAKTPTFDMRKDLEPISRTIFATSGVFVNASLPIKSVADLISYIKANPGKVNYGSVGPGSVNQLTTEALALVADLKMVHVPYSEGTSAMMTALMAGEIQLVLTDVTAGQAAVDSGKVRRIAIVAKERLPSLPDTPTLVETVPQMIEHSGYLWYGMFAPPKTPAPILERVYTAIKACISNKETVAGLKNLGYEETQLEGSRPEVFKKTIIEDHDRLADIVKRAKIELR